MSEANDDEIPVYVYSFKDDPDIEDGFYYSIPVPEEDKSDPLEVFLRGPFETQEAAIEAAHKFIEDALNEWESE